MVHGMDASQSVAAGVDEFELAGIEAAECETISCARVANAPAAPECRLSQIVRLEGDENLLVVGVVTGVHVHDD